MRLWFLILFIYSVVKLDAQQENLFTQYAYNKLSINPALAGTNDYTSLIAIHRDQWTGLTGSPTSQHFTANFVEVLNRIGFGINVQRLAVGIQEKMELSGMYAYKLKVGAYTYSVGLQLSYRTFANDFSHPDLIALDGFENDTAIDPTRYSTSLFNVGVGGYIKSPLFYIGISSPRMIKPQIDNDNDLNIAREVRHYYGMAGLDLQLTPLWEFKPQLLFRYAENSPYDLDVLALMVYQEQVHLGLNIRSGGSQKSILESVDLLLGLRLKEKLFFGIAYDFTTTELREYENGSFEAIIRYDFKKDKGPKEIKNPRYF